jgi:hypothetical protein
MKRNSFYFWELFATLRPGGAAMSTSGIGDFTRARFRKLDLNPSA